MIASYKLKERKINNYEIILLYALLKMLLGIVTRSQVKRKKASIKQENK